MLLVECMSFSPSLCKKLNIEFRKEYYYYGKLSDIALLAGSDFILNNVKVFVRDTDDNTVEGMLYKEIRDIMETTDLEIKGISLGLAINRNAYTELENTDEASLAKMFNNAFSTGSKKVAEITSITKKSDSYYDKVIDDLIDDYSLKEYKNIANMNGKCFRASGSL